MITFYNENKLKFKEFFNKSFKPSVKNRFNKLKVLLSNTHFDFIFLFLASYILTINYSLIERLMFSIGISYWYHLITNYILTKNVMRGNK